MQDAAHVLTQQFLAWIAEAPRSYADAEAWRRSCPHLSVWEDAIANELIQFEHGRSMKEVANSADLARAQIPQRKLIGVRGN